MKPSPEIAAYIARQKLWRDETARLREIVMTRPFSESLKWGKPCYALPEGNVALIQGFKSYFALLLMKGALMPDPENLLIRFGDNVHSGRQMRFADLAEVEARKTTIGAYLDAAIEVERQGLKASPPPPTAEPPEWTARLAAEPALAAAFKTLTPGRRRAYLLFFGGAKQSSTREARIDKWRDQILSGKGIDD
jgi:uncharacterized protein YdeI (YjbR/CyaY-like superfamily)